MNAASYIFFGLLLIPLIIFIIWLIKKDKTKRNYLGLLVLVAMIVVALYAILKYDINFMETGEGSTLKSQSPSYR